MLRASMMALAQQQMYEMSGSGTTSRYTRNILMNSHEEKVEEDCPICMSSMEQDTVVTPCGHHFHKECLEECYRAALQDSRGRGNFPCPLCREPLLEPLPVEASAASGRPIEVCPLPSPGSRCHYDRNYVFISLGDFAKMDRTVLYVNTSNDDRKTPANRVMWTLSASKPITVHLNFRSESHATNSHRWLESHLWAKVPLESTVSSGFPNGPYRGPVYSKVYPEGGEVELYGSECWEGTYFVFIELHPEPGPLTSGEVTNVGRSSASPDSVLDLVQAPPSQGVVLPPAPQIDND